MSSDFGQQQFQRQQFKHKASDLAKAVDKDAIREMLKVPAKGLFFSGLLSLVLIIGGTVGGLIYGSGQTEKLVDNLVWQIFGENRLEEAAAKNAKQSKALEKAKERRDAQAQTVLTLSIGGSIIAASVLCAIQCCSIAGGVLMGQLHNYKLCRMACIIAMVPVLSPLVVVGIPFGFMGLMKLKRTDVKRAFGS